MAGSERARLHRAAAVCVAVALMSTANSCGDFAHNNPFDPAVPVTLKINGPDSAFAQFDTLRFTLTTDPVFDFGQAEWQVPTLIAAGLQKIDNNGTYEVGPIGTYGGKPRRVTVTARLGSRTVSKDLNIIFKPAGYSVSLCDVQGVIVTLDAARAKNLDWIGAWTDVCFNTLDAHGGIITTATTLPSPLRPRDTTVAKTSFTPGRITAVGNGTTNVLFSYGSLTDSVRVTVRQLVTSLKISPAACVPLPGGSMPMSLGDTVRLTLAPPAYDAGGSPITDPAIVQQALAQATWGPLPFQGSVPIVVTSDGLVTATTRGYALVGARLPGSAPGSLQTVATCPIQVQ